MKGRTLIYVALGLLLAAGSGFAGDTNCPPEACFTWCPVCPPVMEAFRFINCSVDPDGVTVSWHWDFGDGTTSTDPEPVHQYERVGAYIVTLTVTDDKGATATRTREITVCRVNQPPRACFTWAPDCPKEGEPFQLTDCSTDADGEIVSWSWEFGDGTTSPDRHPTVQPERAGAYTVTLTVTDSDGASDTVSREIVICEALGTLGVTPGPGLLASPKSLLLIVDASQSMGWWLGHARDQVTRMDAAKAALRGLVAAMPDQLDVGLLVYYNCDRIELVVPVGRLDRTRLLSEIEKLAPTGSTPISGALDRAAGALSGRSGPFLVVLVSDGEETCGGQPVQAARKLATSGLDLRIDVIGLAVEGEPEVVQQLRDIAAAGVGTYYSAESTDALLTALRLAAPIRFAVYDDDGARVASGVVGDLGITLRAGRYAVVIETALGNLTVEATVWSEKETRVEVEYKEGVFRASVL